MSETITNAQRTTGRIGLAVLLILIFAGANKFGTLFLHLDPLASRDLFWWSMLFITLLYVRFVERRPFSSIGLIGPRWTTLLFGVVTALVLMYVAFPLTVWLVATLHLSANAGNAAANIYAHTPYWYHWLLVTRAAFAEEVIFRGYMIQRTEDLTGSRILAAVLSLVTFCDAHLAFWGWIPLIGIAAASVPLIALYLWRRDLWACILAHWITDAAQLIV